jgi:hypothetical protein
LNIAITDERIRREEREDRERELFVRIVQEKDSTSEKRFKTESEVTNRVFVIILQLSN